MNAREPWCCCMLYFLVQYAELPPGGIFSGNLSTRWHVFYGNLIFSTVVKLVFRQEEYEWRHLVELGHSGHAAWE